jgi:hypothetical protein
MQCVFLFRKGKVCCCEVLVDGYGEKREPPSSWVCKNAWKDLCPYYQDAMDIDFCSIFLAERNEIRHREEGKPVERVVDEIPGLHPSRIGHFNRIGGYRDLLTHQT